MTTGMGLYRSNDGGDTWTHLTPHHGFRIGYPDMLIFSPLDDRTMFMCGAFSNPGTWIELPHRERDRDGQPRSRRDVGSRHRTACPIR